MTMCESEIIISSPPTIGDTLSRLISNNHEMKNNNNGQEEKTESKGFALLNFIYMIMINKFRYKFGSIIIVQNGNDVVD